MMEQLKSFKTGKSKRVEMTTNPLIYAFISLQIINEKNQEIWDELREEMHGVSSLVC